MNQHSIEPLDSIGILGTGSSLPDIEVSNAELSRKVGVAEDWIERKTRILARRFVAPNEATSDLAACAGEHALENGRVSVDAVDYIIVSTSTPDYPQPPTAALVQHRIGATNAACFDLNAVCSGFVYGLTLAHGLLALRPGSTALVIGADVYSRILDFGDRTTAVLLGDGAGAVLLGSVPPGYGLVGSGLYTRGDAHDLIRVRAGGSRHPTSHETVDVGGHFFRMQGRKVADFVLAEVPTAISGLVRQAGFGIEEIDHFVPHQPNGNLLDDLVTETGLGDATTHKTIEKYGNVGSACIPVALDEANRRHAFNDSDLVLLAGFGGGMAIGTALLRWWSA